METVEIPDGHGRASDKRASKIESVENLHVFSG
jgi:hypothetical protein